MTTPSRVVIVGAGQAGAAAAVALREGGFDGSVTLIGAESDPPYERPPLSKTYLRGESSRKDAHLQAEESWAARGVELRTGVAVDRIDRAAGRLELADGQAVAYDRLVLATGAAPRTLAVPGADLDGIETLRTFADADRIGSLAREAQHVLVVGGGWIGSEVTASLRQMGVPVTLAVSGDRPLGTALGGTVAGVYDALHREHHVDVRPRTRIVALEGDGSVRRAQTAAGDWITADLVVTAVGASPRVDLARAAGLTVSDGIVVDGLLQTDDPSILAVGDVAQAPYPDLGRSLRFEHWGTAQTQGTHAARSILGDRSPYAEFPYFFSDQYDTGMEFWGDPELPGAIVVRGDVSARSFTAFWLDAGRVRAALNMHVHHHEHADHHEAAEDAAQGTRQHDPGHDGGRGHGDEQPDAEDEAPAAAHAGGHVDPAVVTALLRRPGQVDARVLGDPAVPLQQLLPVTS